MQRCRYGVRLDALDDALLREVIAIYDTTVGGHGTRFTRGRSDGSLTEYVQRGHQYGNAAEWRYGSRLSGHGKLFVWAERGSSEDLVRFSFDPNDAEGPEADALVAAFAEAIDVFLRDHPLGVELPKR